MWVLFNIFEIAFFWKCFIKVIYPVFLWSSYKTTAPKLTILTHDFLCSKGAEFMKHIVKTHFYVVFLLLHPAFI